MKTNMESNISTIIFSVCQGTKSKGENVSNTLLVANSLKESTDAIVIPAEGVYKGEKEFSFVITNPSKKIMQAIGFFAKRFNQESILVIDNQHNASLLYSKSGELKSIGRLQFVDEVRDDEDHTKLLLDKPLFLKIA